MFNRIAFVGSFLDTFGKNSYIPEHGAKWNLHATHQLTQRATWFISCSIVGRSTLQRL